MINHLLCHIRNDKNVMYNICVFIRACQTYLLLKETVYQNRFADNTCVVGCGLQETNINL